MPSYRRYAIGSPLALALAGLPWDVAAAPWQIDPERTLPGAGDVTQKVELADLDADGFVDLVFANSKGDQNGGPGDAQLNQAIRNDGGQQFVDFGIFNGPDNAYVIKAGDVDGDGWPDLVVGVNFAGESRLLLGIGNGFFLDAPIEPGLSTSIGDLELGDLDGDGDLDIVAADWGTTPPFGAPGDPGGPLRLWLGDGAGNFSDGAFLLPPGMDAFTTHAYDLELLDFDNDFDLDVVIASPGPGHARVLVNDGVGGLSLFAVPALNPLFETAFTVLDLQNDSALDLVALQAGPNGGNTVMVNTGANFANNLGAYWALVDNPKRNDFDAATHDFDNDSLPDLLVLGPQINPGEVHARLFLNDGASLNPYGLDAAAFPVLPELAQSFGLQLADLDNDHRIDAVVAVRDEQANNALLFATDEVPEDVTPPLLAMQEAFPASVSFGEIIRLRARVHDFRTPARWHDFWFDPDLALLNLSPGTLINHKRRLPYFEIAVGLDDPAQLELIPDSDPAKVIVPGTWYGESLWEFAWLAVDLDAPAPIQARLCAIDAAGNKACSTTESSFLVLPRPPQDCGDGVKERWEDCDDPNNPLCVNCWLTCPSGTCDANEDVVLCPEDCAVCGDGILSPGEDCDDAGDPLCVDCILTCGNGLCDGNENPVLCFDDCGEPEGGCGDGVVDASEECDDAIDPLCVDCKLTCGDCICDPNETFESCPEDCSAGPCGANCGDGQCDAPFEDFGSCPEDCGPPCGDGLCSNPPENSDNCPADCGFCGDGFCQPGESGATCIEDCPPVPTDTDGTFCGDGVCDEDEVGWCPEDCAVCFDGGCEDDGGPDDGGGQVDPGGCGCRGSASGGPLGLFILLLARRRRRET